MEVLENNKKRLRFAMLNEQISTGAPGMDANVTRLSEVVMGQAKGLLELQQETRKVSLKIEASNVGPHAGAATQGILSRLFGSTQPLDALPPRNDVPQIITTQGQPTLTTPAGEEEVVVVDRSSDVRSGPIQSEPEQREPVELSAADPPLAPTGSNEA